MPRKDPLQLIEAAYSFERDEKAWLEGLVAALEPYELGRGVAAYTSNLGAKVGVRSAAERKLQVPLASLSIMESILPPAFYRRIHAPFALSCQSRNLFPEAAAEFGISLPEYVERVFTTFKPTAPVPAWAVSGGDPNVEGVLVVFHSPDDDTRFSARDENVLDCLGAHLSAALRLRSLLRDRPVGGDPSVDAVIAPDGKLLDARPAALDERESLVDAVRRSERARTRHATDEERLDVWTGLVEGRWSILESVERDGKRTLLACRNEPRTAATRALTTRERSIAHYAALGHSLKYIAYEMGMPLATVASDLALCLRKLGLASRAELVHLFTKLNLAPDEDAAAKAPATAVEKETS